MQGYQIIGEPRKNHFYAQVLTIDASIQKVSRLAIHSGRYVNQIKRVDNLEDTK